MTEERIAWFHCFSGVAGNMALGSLIAAGASEYEISEMVRKLDISAFVIEATPVLRGGVSATHVDVKIDDDKTTRDYKAIRQLIDESELPSRVKERSLSVFALLAQVEADIHGTDIDNVHFHEVGGMDAIVDVVGTCSALELLDIDAVACSSIANGVGTIESSHGTIPNPPPAVVQLLNGIPATGRNIKQELTTPTGAALMAALSREFGEMPPMIVETSGYGAGTTELDQLPNATQVIIGIGQNDADEGTGQPLIVLETTVDDITGEVVSYTVDRLLEAGAHDAWITNVMMKKGRPGFVITCLADPSTANELRDILGAESGSFGVRASYWERWPQSRKFEQISVDGKSMRVKVGKHRAKIEFDDAANAAKELGRFVRDVISEAESKITGKRG